MTTKTLACWLLSGLLAAGCVEKDPDVPTKGPKPLSRAEKLRLQKHLLKAPPTKLRFPVNGDLDGKVTYLGLHTPDAAVTPGKPFQVIHYFQVKAPLRGWKLFVHTNGPKLSDFRNFDHVPVFGLHPVTSWQPGQIVEDRHTILLPKNTPYQTVELYVGIWRGRQRLKVRAGTQDGANRLLAARIPVGRQSASARPTAPPLPTYVVRRAKGKLTLDGKGDEPDWQAAPATAPWADSLKGAAKSPRTDAKLLWDDQHLYVLFSAEDDDVWATVTKADDPKLWTEQAFEIFVDADGDGAGYIELQVNPRGAVFDAYLPRPGQVQADWQSGCQAKVSVIGTLDKRDDKDTSWQVELAIPWAALKGRAATAFPSPPPVGTRLRANLFRTDRPKDGALQAWAWSPPRRATFHALERFGTLVLGDPEGRTGTAAPPRARAASPAPGMGAPPARGAARPATAPPPRAPAARPAGMGPTGGMK